MKLSPFLVDCLKRMVRFVQSMHRKEFASPSYRFSSSLRPSARCECRECPEGFDRRHERSLPDLLASAPFFVAPSTMRELFFDQPFQPLTDARLILVSEL